MSLNQAQKKQTREELRRNYQISGLAPADILRDLGLDEEQLEMVLELGDGVDPTDVWRVRDYMEEIIIASGKKPYPYSALKVNRWYPYK